MAPTTREIEAYKTKIEVSKKILDKLDKRIAGLQTTAFTLANYFIVFQGVIISLICNKSSVLGHSDRWFPFTLSVLVVVLNCSALFNIGRRYYRANGEYRHLRYKHQQLLQQFGEAQQESTVPQNQINEERLEHEPYLMLVFYSILFLAISSIVLYGCWNFLDRKKMMGNLPNVEKCTRVCGDNNCIRICIEH